MIGYFLNWLKILISRNYLDLINIEIFAIFLKPQSRHKYADRLQKTDTETLYSLLYALTISIEKCFLIRHATRDLKAGLEYSYTVANRFSSDWFFEELFSSSFTISPEASIITQVIAITFNFLTAVDRVKSDVTNLLIRASTFPSEREISLPTGSHWRSMHRN